MVLVLREDAPLISRHPPYRDPNQREVLNYKIISLSIVLCCSLISGCGSSTDSNRAPAGDGPSAAPAADGPSSGGTLNVGLHLPLTTLDWQSSVSHPLPMVMGHVYEGLFGLGSDFTAVPDLVDSYAVSEEGQVWTFDLREGVTFHNGKILDSDDVKASLERWRRIGPKGSGLADLNAIDTPDANTVVLRFGNAMGQFLLLLLASDENKAVIMPKEIAEASTTPGQVTEVIGTGPYRFVEYKEDQYVRLEKYDGYVARTDEPNYQAGRKDTYLDEVIFWVVPEASTRVAGLESGEYHIITEVPDSEAERLREVEDVEPIKNGPGVLLYMMFNHKQGLTSDLNIRRAIQAMVDPAEITSMVVSDPTFSLSDESIFAPESAYNTKLESTPELTSEEYLQRAGYDGTPIFIQVISTDVMQQRIAVVLVEQAKRVGLDFRIASYDLSTWVAKRTDPSAMNIYTSAGYWIDPSLWHPEFNGSFPSEAVGFSSSETDDIFSRLASATDFEQRMALAGELQSTFYDQVAMVNLGYVYRLVAKNTQVHDPQGNLALGNLTLHGIWIE